MHLFYSTFIFEIASQVYFVVKQLFSSHETQFPDDYKSQSPKLFWQVVANISQCPSCF
jgi:hypothetical protein